MKMGLASLLFVLRGTPLESLKYSPFELVLGHHPWSLLQILREDWELPATVAQDPTMHRQAFQRRVQLARDIATENLRQAQQQQKEKYNADNKR